MQTMLASFVANIYPHKSSERRPPNTLRTLAERCASSDDAPFRRSSGHAAQSVHRSCLVSARTFRPRELCNQHRILSQVSRQRSYRLRRHFPLLCDSVNRIPYPYQTLPLPEAGRSGTSGSRLRAIRFLFAPPRAKPSAEVSFIRNQSERPQASACAPPLHATSSPSSRPGSSPEKPSRGTEYG